MKKIGTYIALTILSALIGGCYGIVHDQLTYTISPEYYTKFKFIQFGFIDSPKAFIAHPRLWVGAVGFLATWWMGLSIGIVLSLVGLVHVNYKSMFIITCQAIFLTISITALIGVIGMLYGYFYLSEKSLPYFKDWFIPDDLADFRSFITVGSMHNFSYAGGVIGFFAGSLFSIYKSGKGLRWLLLYPRK